MEITVVRLTRAGLPARGEPGPATTFPTAARVPPAGRCPPPGPWDVHWPSGTRSVEGRRAAWSAARIVRQAAAYPCGPPAGVLPPRSSAPGTDESGERVMADNQTPQPA